MSVQTLKVLGALMSSMRDELAGSEIAVASKLSSGTLYPILMRLEAEGWLESRWEVDDPHVLRRPRKRFYRVTSIGAQKTKAAFQDISTSFPKVAWA